MFVDSNRMFLLFVVINMNLLTVKGLLPPHENDKFLLQNITRIWRSVDPKVITIIIHDVVGRNTCYDICNEIGSKGPVTTVTFDRLENCSVIPRERISTKRLVLFIYTGKECPTTDESQKIVDVMRTQCWWLQRAHLLYLLATADLCDDVKFMYRQFWDLRILSISIMTYDVRDTGSLTLHDCNSFTGSCERMRDPSFAKPFTDDILNMYGFPLTRSVVNVVEAPNASTIESYIQSLYNVEVSNSFKIVDLLTKRLKATKRLKVREQIGHFGDSYRGIGAKMVSDIAEGRADILPYSSFLGTRELFQDLAEETTFSEFTSICAIVPIDYQVTADQLNGIFIFLGIIPCVIGIAFVVSTLLRFKYEAGTPFQIYLILVGGGLSHLPTRSPPRILLITWISSSMILSTALQNHLIRSLIIKPKPTHIQTLSELDASGRIILVHSSLVYVIFGFDVDDTAILRMRQRSEPYRSNEENCPTLIQGPWKGNATCLLDTPTAKWFIKATTRDDSPVFAVASECFLNQYKSFRVSCGSPYLPSINKLLLRMHDFGISNKLMQDSWLTVSYSPTQSTEDAIDSEFSAISWNSLRQAFFLLLAGEAVAALVFCVEVIVHYVINNKKNVNMKSVEAALTSRTLR